MLYERIAREWPGEAQDLTANGAAAALGLVRIELAVGEVEGARTRAAALLPAIERSSGRADMPDEEAETHLRLGISLLRLAVARDRGAASELVALAARGLGRRPGAGAAVHDAAR